MLEFLATITEDFILPISMSIFVMWLLWLFVGCFIRITGIEVVLGVIMFEFLSTITQDFIIPISTSIVVMWLLWLFIDRFVEDMYLQSIHEEGSANAIIRGILRMQTKLMVILGSGGHTTEVLRILQNMQFRMFTYRFYIVGKSDYASQRKVIELEWYNPDYVIKTIPRFRNVRESWFISLLKTPRAVFSSMIVILQCRPHVILCNGPAICIPLVFFAFITNILHLSDTCVIYVESLCRLRTMSLSGYILRFLAHDVIFHWDETYDTYGGLNAGQVDLGREFTGSSYETSDSDSQEFVDF